MKDVGGWLGVALVSAAAMTMALCLFAWDADGAFLVNDPLWYGKAAEEGGAIQGHHPGFHIAVNGVTDAIRAVSPEVKHPGHVAIRVVSGLGMILVIILLAVIAGPGRRWIGAGLGLALLATRGVCLETATGETVVVAAAFALGTLWVAARGARMGTVLMWLLAALLIRQDNLLIVPGVVWAWSRRQQIGQRWKRCFLLLVSGGILTLAGYAACYVISASAKPLPAAETQPNTAAGEVEPATEGSAPTQSLEGFVTWMLKLAQAEGRTWAKGTHPDPALAKAHLSALGVALVGLQAPITNKNLHLGIAGAWVMAMLIGGWLGRCRSHSEATAWKSAFCMGSILTILVRFPFFLWFEPFNWEWWIVPMVLIVGMAAALSRGPSVRSAAHVGWATAWLCLCALVLAFPHLKSTWALRDRTLAEARDLAVELGGGSAEVCRFISYRPKAAAAFHVADIPHQFNLLQGPPQVALETLKVEMAKNPTRTVLLVDRFIRIGMPYELRVGTDDLDLLDVLRDKPGEKFIRMRDKVVVLGWFLN